MAKVTIAEIAKKAGVSKTSVSFAFNNPDRLAPATVERILKVAAELGYTPDPVARNLKKRRTGCIGLLVPQAIPVVARNPHTFDLIEGIGQVFEAAGRSLMIIPPHRGSLQRAVIRAAVDGFLTFGLEAEHEAMETLLNRDIPFVMIDSDPLPGVPCVNIDDQGGAYDAMRYVLAHGHRRVAILTIHRGDPDEYRGSLKRRMDGYAAALAEVGLAVKRDVPVVGCDADVQSGHRAFERLWRRQPRPTALVSMSDIAIIGVLQAARARGVAVPEELSLVGYDDILSSGLIVPPLTTIRQPVREKGRLAAQLLMDLIRDNPIAEPEIVLPTEFVERESVRRSV